MRRVRCGWFVVIRAGASNGGYIRPGGPCQQVLVRQPKPNRMKHPYAFSLFALGLLAPSLALAQRPTTVANAAQQSLFDAKMEQAPAPYAHSAVRGGGPANDECAGAITISVGATCTPTSGSLDGATESMPAATCSGFTATVANDVWYTFTATGTTTVISVTGGGDGTTGPDPIIELFSGSCADLASMGCLDASLVDGTEAPAFTTVVGATYYYRIYYWPYTTPPTVFDFTTCVYTPSPIPANDVCTGATPQALAAGGSVTFSGNNSNATDTELLGFPTLWHAFTTTECTNLALTYCTTDPAFGNAFLNLWTDCPATTAQPSASYNLTDCPDGNVTIYYANVPAGTYYYGVLTAANATGPYTITVAAEPCDAPPANDDCAGAFPLTVGTFCNNVPFTAANATESLPAAQCSGFTGNANDDVWFSFVATAADVTVGATGTDDGDGNNQTGYDAVVEAFDGCGGTSLGCIDGTLSAEPEGLELTGLTVGNTYYVRVYNYYTSLPVPNSGTVCVVLGTGINIGIQENSDADIWSIFPNPTEGSFNLSYAGKTATADIEVIDVTGRLVYSERAALVAGSVRTIDLSNLGAGNYTVRLTAGGERSTQRLMVK